MSMEYNRMFLSIKEYTQYEAIPYVKDFKCPNCGKSGDGFHHVPGKGYVELPKSKLIGWCNTSCGYMMVFECTECFEKFRYHNTTNSRYNWEKFKDDLLLVYMLQK